MSHMDDGMLHTYLDGELGAAGEAQLREHLATCAECRGRLDLARATRTRAHEILRFADPVAIEQPDFATVLARRTAPAVSTEPARRRATVRPLLLPWAASLVLALGAGWFAQALLTGGGASGGAERVATMQSEESAAAPADDAVTQPEVGEAARVFSADAGDSRPTAMPETPLAAVTTETGAPQAAAMRTEAPPAARDVTVEAAGAEADATPLRARGGGADLARAAENDEELAAAAVVITGAAADRQVPGPDARRGEARLRSAAMQAAAPPPPPPALQPAPGPAGWPTAWNAVDAAGAARALGDAPLAIADLQVVGYQVSSDGSGAVRVLQPLPGGELLELLQRRAQAKVAGYEAGAAQAEGAGAVTEATPMQLGFTRDGVEILIRAQVSSDSLQRLREAVR